MGRCARLAVVLCAVLFAAFDARGQEPVALEHHDGPWVATPGPDGRVKVLTTRGIWISGRMIDLTPEALTLLDGSARREIPRADVFQVWQPRERGGLVKGAVVGALAMLALGAAAWAADECRHDECAPGEEFKAADLGWATLGGALIGGIVGGTLIEGRPSTLLYSKTVAAATGTPRGAEQHASLIRMSLRF